MRPVDSELHEAIVLDGHKSKAVSDSNDPPNSYHTSDLFVPHKTIPDAWKFFGRLDDRLTLLNGEKVLPLTIEGRIRQHALVKEAVIFGRPFWSLNLNYQLLTYIRGRQTSARFAALPFGEHGTSQ
jgi:hypothetical protein